MKVAHVTTVDISLRYLLLNQLKALREGYEVIAISSPGPHVEAVTQAGIRHIPVPMTRRITPGPDIQSLWRLYKIMRRERFAIVHTHTPKAGLLGQIAAKMAGVQVVINTLHGFYFHDHMNGWARRFHIAVEKIAACCSDRILSQNDEDIGTAIREGICAPEKLASLGNGIDLLEFDPVRVSASEGTVIRERLGIPDSAPVVGFVGRLAARRKGFLDFLAAGRLLTLRYPEVHFLIVGEADHGKADAVEPSAAADYGIAERCHFVGALPNAELPPCYRAMNVLVLPSLFEGLPRVVMEASAMGVPSVVSDVKGNREAVAQGRNGFLVPLGDVDALAEATGRVIADPVLGAQMAMEARCIALERFDERRVFEFVKGEYNRLLKGGKTMTSS